MGCTARAGSAASGGDDEAAAAGEAEAAGEDGAGDPTLAASGGLRRCTTQSSVQATDCANASAVACSNTSQPLGA